MRISNAYLLASCLVVGLSACGDDDPITENGANGVAVNGTIGTNGGNGTNGSNGQNGTSDVPDAGPIDSGHSDGGTDPALERCELAESVACVDEQITDLRYFEEPSPDGVTNEPLDDGFRSVIDATGGVTFGGGPPLPSHSFVYLRFTEEGLEKLEISDVDAFESGEWDIAARRYIIRVNSGVAGPSCTRVARTAPDTEYDALASVPDGLTYRTEEYYSPEDCTIISDGGLGGPATALNSYWTYQACVEMTGNVYVLELADGRFVKLQVESYYAPEVQDYCDANKQLPTDMPSGSGRLQVRWAFIE